MNKHKAFSIGATAKLAGVTQKQLRHWEARGYISPPTRVRMGDRAYRYYSQAQLEKIKSVKGIEVGTSIGLLFNAGLYESLSC
jgi:DNA-binding transcriptional MerR regulator